MSITHPCPPWVQTAQANDSFSEKSASSSTMSADLPPSSRKSRFSVGAPFSMIRRPTAVDPVNEMRSTRGSVTRSSATWLSVVVTTWKTPAGKSVRSATNRPILVAFHGRVGGGLQDDRVAGGQRLADLVDGHLEGVVPGHDGGHHPHRLLEHPAPAAHPEGLSLGQVPLPGELVDEVGRPCQPVGQRLVELGAVGQQHRGAHLGHQFGAQQLHLVLERGLQLQQAPLAQFAVGRPVGLVEGPAGGADGAVHVLVAGVSGGPSTSSVAGLTLSNRRPEIASSSFPSMSIRASPVAVPSWVVVMVRSSSTVGCSGVTNHVLLDE